MNRENMLSIGNIASKTGMAPAAVQRKLERNHVSPALQLSGVTYYRLADLTCMASHQAILTEFLRNVETRKDAPLANDEISQREDDKRHTRLQIPVQNLCDEAIEEILQATLVMREQAKRFAGELQKIVVDERGRRNHPIGDSIEPAISRLATPLYSDEELSAAVVYGIEVLTIVHHPLARRFIGHALINVAAHLGPRFQTFNDALDRAATAIGKATAQTETRKT